MISLPLDQLISGNCFFSIIHQHPTKYQHIFGLKSSHVLHEAQCSTGWNELLEMLVLIQKTQINIMGIICQPESEPPFRGWNPQPYHSAHLKHWGWFRWVSFWGREIRQVLVWVCVVLGRSPRPKKSRQMQTRHELFVALQHPQLQLLDVQSGRISSFLPQIWIANTEALREVWAMCGVLRRYKKYMMLTWLNWKVL